MKTIKLFSIIAILAISLSACYTNVHVVGEGAKSEATVVKSQWYAVWGLIPLNKVDSKAMAGGATNYQITTKHTFGDQFISMFTNVLTISRSTVEVKK